MVGRDVQGRRFDSMVQLASDPWRMLAVCVIGQALDDICPRAVSKPEYLRPLPRQAAAMEVLHALSWVSGTPAGLPAEQACSMAGIALSTLRDEALDRLARRGWYVTDEAELEAAA